MAELSEQEFMRLPADEQDSYILEQEFLLKPPEEQEKILAEMDESFKTGALEAGIRGFGQAVTFNGLDEIMGFVRGVNDSFSNDKPLGESIDLQTELSRRPFRKAERDQPGATMAGQAIGIGGMAAALPATGLARAAGSLGTVARLGAGTGLGALAGAGASEGEIGSEELNKDIMAGGLAGAVGQGAFGLGKKVLGKPISKLVDKATNRNIPKSPPGKIVIDRDGLSESQRSISRNIKNASDRIRFVEKSQAANKIGTTTVRGITKLEEGLAKSLKGKEKSKFIESLKNSLKNSASFKTSIPRPIARIALDAVKKPFKAGLDMTINLFNEGSLPVRVIKTLSEGLEKNGSAGLANAYLELINTDEEFKSIIEGNK